MASEYVTKTNDDYQTTYIKGVMTWYDLSNIVDVNVSNDDQIEVLIQTKKPKHNIDVKMNLSILDEFVQSLNQFKRPTSHQTITEFNSGIRQNRLKSFLSKVEEMRESDKSKEYSELDEIIDILYDLIREVLK